MAVETEAPSAQPGLEHVPFTKLYKDIPVHFQVLSLPKQTLIWVACGPARLRSLSAATVVPQTGLPAVTSLIGWAANSSEQGLASRLAQASGKAVMVSLNLPSNSAGMEAFVEQELKGHLLRQ
ncbi:hypothetical protein ACKKBF_B10845 [Auxenochlorella protothecoides x Auxenochlorella symbiontica]